MDPKGVNDTIDPDVDVLRVDKVTRKRRIPIGAWSNFADHGTVIHSEWRAYSGDHHAAAWRVFSTIVRRHGHVPARQTVVNVYGNADEGDQTAGIAHVGPAAADWVGTQEALAMVRAWRQAGAHLRRTPALDLRWTRTCFCGRNTATGKVDTQGREGMGFLTGSEEERGPLYDITHVSFEGRTSPYDDPVQGDKYVIPGAGNPPPAVPIAVVHVGDHVLTCPSGRSDEGGRGAHEAGAGRRDGPQRRATRGHRRPRRRLRPVHRPHRRGTRAAELRGRLDCVRQERGHVLPGEQLVDLGKRMDTGPAGAGALRVRSQLRRHARRRPVPGRAPTTAPR